MSDLQIFQKIAGKRPETQILIKWGKKTELTISGIAVRLLWRAAAAGLTPIRLPRAQNEASSCPGIFSRTLPTRVAFTVSLAPPVHPSPIFLTDTENLQDVVQFQQGHVQGQFGIIGEVS